MDWRNAIILTFLVTQMLFPFVYYVPGGRDSARLPGVSPEIAEYDERFAWRMFSDIRMVRCQATYAVDGRTVELSQEFHSAWGSLLSRGRPDVVRRVGERLCERGEPVTLVLVCRHPDKSIRTLSSGSVDICGGS